MNAKFLRIAQFSAAKGLPSVKFAQSSTSELVGCQTCQETDQIRHLRVLKDLLGTLTSPHYRLGLIMLENDLNLLLQPLGILL